MTVPTQQHHRTGRGGNRQSSAARVTAACVALFSLGTSAFAQPAGGPAAPPPSVIVETVKMADITDQTTYTGRIQAIDKVAIRARIDGFLANRGFDEGSEVKKDQILFTLEKDSYQAALALAEANLASAQAAEQLAQATYDRTKPLAERGTSTQAALDDATAKLAQAKADVQARQANVETAKLNLSYTEIRAPMDGRTGRATYSVGEYVSPSSDPLVTVVHQDPMYVAFPVPQRVLMEVREQGVTRESVVVKLKMPDGSTYDQDGTIKFAEVVGNAGTDTVTVRAEIANPKRILVDQQLVGVVVIAKEPERKLVVSQSAIMLSAQGASVLAVTPDNKVETRKVVVGEQRGADIVITSGLAEGDRVIVNGQQKVRPGIVVEPSEAKDDLSSASK